MPNWVTAELYSTPIILKESPELEAAFRGVDNRDWFATPELPISCAVKAVVYSGIGNALASLPLHRLAELRAKTELLEPLQPALACVEERLGERITNRVLADACFM